MVQGTPTSGQSRTLKVVLAQDGVLPSPVALALCWQLLRQLRALHDAGITHRALGPDAVLVDARGQVSLAAVEPVQLLDGADAGLDYCPPELAGIGVVRLPAAIDSARDELARVNVALDPRRIDIYQLGTLLCRALTGQSVSTYLCSPKTKSRVPALFQRLIDCALGHNPVDRLTDCEACAEVLEALVRESSAALAQTQHARGGSTSLFVAEEDTSFVLNLPSEDVPFTQLAHYRIERRIGHGGMGDVYLGYEEALQRPVAIKVLPAGLARDEGLVRRFQAEATAAARLSHPHIVPIHFIGQDAGHHFFVMQYVEGESLQARLLRQERLAPDEALRILEQCLEGLAAAHHAGLIHRDVKPGNILLDGKTGRALLADFGLVKTSGSGLTDSGTVLGTLDYIAPEQAQAQAVDGRADLYALGVVAYQMLSGRLPFQADTASAMLFQHAYGTPTPLHLATPEKSQSLAALVERMMAKDPAERYPNCEEVLADLRRWRGGQPLAACAQRPSAAPPSRAPSPSGWDQTARLAPEQPGQRAGSVRRPGRRWQLAAAGMAAALLLAAGVYFAWPPRPTRTPPTNAPPVSEPPAANAPAERIPGAAAEDELRRPGMEVSIRPAPRKMPRPLVGAAVTAAAFSPDARFLLIADSGLRLWDVENNRELHDFGGKMWGPVRAAVWSADGRRVLVGGSEIREGKFAGFAVLFEATTGQVVSLFRGHETPVCAVALSADGTEALTAGEAPPDNRAARVMDADLREFTALCRWDAATGTERNRYRGPAAPVHSIAFAPDRRRVFAAGSMADPYLYSWDANNADLLRTRFPRGVRSHAAVLPDASKVAVLRTNWGFKVYAVVDGKHLNEVCHSEPLSRIDNGKTTAGAPVCPTWSRDGHFLAIASTMPAQDPRKAPIFLADARSGVVLHQLEGHRIETRVLAIANDGRFVFSSAKDGPPRLWADRALKGNDKPRALKPSPPAADSPNRRVHN